jgi:ATP-dependent protease ClpP protease subunit
MGEVALVFHGPINGPATTKLRNAICGMANGGSSKDGLPPSRLWLLMSSGGGNLEDGFSLYTLLRSLQVELVTVNMGQIASIANVPFLAGNHRIACPDAYFHFHDFDYGFVGAHTMSRDNIADTRLQLEIARTNKKSIFKDRTKLTDADFEALHFLEEPAVQDASFAKSKGIIHDISFPNLPAGTPIFNVDY